MPIKRQCMASMLLDYFVKSEILMKKIKIIIKRSFNCSTFYVINEGMHINKASVL